MLNKVFSVKKVIFNWQTLLAVILISLSAILYSFHFTLFNDAHHIFIYLVGDIAFVPIEVLLVTLIIHKVLDIKEKKEQLNKLNMVIGIFFSEVGTPLINLVSDFEDNTERIANLLKNNNIWQKNIFKNNIKSLSNIDYDLNLNIETIKEIKEFISSKKEFQLNLLANSNLLEHDSFTDLLWAVFHMTEELVLRENFDNITQNDLDHLVNDIKRSYTHLIKEWFYYMKHLHDKYPYLFALALRKNPFDKTASIILK